MPENRDIITKRQFALGFTAACLSGVFAWPSGYQCSRATNLLATESFKFATGHCVGELTLAIAPFALAWLTCEVARRISPKLLLRPANLVLILIGSIGAIHVVMGLLSFRGLASFPLFQLLAFIPAMISGAVFSGLVLLVLHKLKLYHLPAFTLGGIICGILPAFLVIMFNDVSLRIFGRDAMVQFSFWCVGGGVACTNIWFWCKITRLFRLT
jgi:hypothetical protein